MWIRPWWGANSSNCSCRSKITNGSKYHHNAVKRSRNSSSTFPSSVSPLWSCSLLFPPASPPKSTLQASNCRFDPNIGHKLVWILLLSFVEISVAKCSETTISNLNIGFLQLTSLVSYRFVPLAILTILLTLLAGVVPYLNLFGLVYLLVSDTYFCVMTKLFRGLN